MINKLLFSAIQKFWNEKPFLCILVAAAFFRLLAVIFSKGFAMSDDHFLVIEPAQSWVDGHGNYWLPYSTEKIVKPSGHSLLYPGLHYFLFKTLQFFGIYDPQPKMYVVRLLHAAWSMITVYLGYKIALRISGIKAAKMAGILLAILFFMPMMSVRNLVEFVCIPPLMYATWLVIKNQETHKKIPFISAGFFLGLAFSIRFQTSLFIAGFGLALLLQKKWKQAFATGAGLLLCVALVQASTDMVIWHQPFMEFREYVRYNMENAETYGVARWYIYVLFLSGILIPPVSLFILFGFLKSRKKHLILFLPALVFFVFHSSFPNKQERFILPVIPFIITLGSVGWCEFIAKSAFWNNNKKLYRAGWIFFWSLNTVPLIVVSTAYSHRSRVEAMVYLSHKKDFRNMVIEESNRSDFTIPPLFYLQHWIHTYSVTSAFPPDSLKMEWSSIPAATKPNYVVFNQQDNFEKRLEDFKKAFPGLTYETTIEPGFIDNVMHRLNSINANYTSYIYKINE